MTFCTSVRAELFADCRNYKLLNEAVETIYLHYIFTVAISFDGESLVFLSVVQLCVFSGFFSPTTTLKMPNCKYFVAIALSTAYCCELVDYILM